MGLSVSGACCDQTLIFIDLVFRFLNRVSLVFRCSAFFPSLRPRIEDELVFLRLSCWLSTIVISLCDVWFAGVSGYSMPEIEASYDDYYPALFTCHTLISMSIMSIIVSTIIVIPLIVASTSTYSDNDSWCVSHITTVTCLCVCLILPFCVFFSRIVNSLSFSHACLNPVLFPLLLCSVCALVYLFCCRVPSFALMCLHVYAFSRLLVCSSFFPYVQLPESRPSADSH